MPLAKNQANAQLSTKQISKASSKITGKNQKSKDEEEEVKQSSSEYSSEQIVFIERDPSMDVKTFKMI
jgi:hypothetical protein